MWKTQQCYVDIDQEHGKKDMTWSNISVKKQTNWDQQSGVYDLVKLAQYICQCLSNSSWFLSLVIFALAISRLFLSWYHLCLHFLPASSIFLCLHHNISLSSLSITVSPSGEQALPLMSISAPSHPQLQQAPVLESHESKAAHQRSRELPVPDSGWE